MAFGRTFAGELLELLLNNAAIANIGDAGGLQPSAADGTLYISAHTADPGATGDQTTNECAYTGYTRIDATRDGTFWTITDDEAALDVEDNFGACTVGTGTITHIMLGTASSGAGKQLIRGAISPNIAFAPGVTPKLTTDTRITLLDA